MEYNIDFQIIAGIFGIVIVIWAILYFLLDGYKELFKHFSKKSLQEKQFSIIFASEKERDRVLALMKRDKEETEDLEKQAALREQQNKNPQI